MMQGIRFELKKYVITKSHFVILFVITLAEIGMLFFNEGGYFVEKKTRQDFYSQAERNFSGTSKQDLIEESEQLNQELYKTDADGVVVLDKEEIGKAGKYSDTRINDYAFLNELITGMEVIEKRNRNTALLADTYEGAFHDYEKEENPPLPPDRKKLTAAVHNMSFGWIPCLVLIILFSASFAVEYENSINPVLRITKKGGWAVSMAKIMTGMSAAVALNVYFWGIYIILQAFFLGMTRQDWGQPLFLAEGCQMCASGATIQGLLVKQIIVSILVSVLMAMFTMVLSRWIKKGNYALLAALLIFVVMLLPDLLNTLVYNSTYLTGMNDWYLVSEPTFYRLLNFEKTFNPVSMIQFQYYAEQPRYTQIFGYQYPIYCFPVMLAVILIGIFGIILFYEKSGRYKK